jgi:ABC-type multidrug transport system permease subunit
VIVVVTVVALLAQMNIGGNGVDLFGLYALGLLLNLAGTLWAAGVAMRLRTQQAAPVMQMPVFLILIFAPVYVPLGLLQGWIHGVASVNPLTALLQAGRGLISGRPELTVAAFAIVAGLIAGFALWAVRGLRRAEAAG